MNRWCWLLVLLLAPAWGGEDIVDVLRRSHEDRMQSTVEASTDSFRARMVRASFAQLQLKLDPMRSAALRVVKDDQVIAETLRGHVIVASESLADLPESARLFVLAHELGHVQMQHWKQTEVLYQKWVPSAVTPDRTDPVAMLLGRDASRLAHAQEYAADAYAFEALRSMGQPQDELLAVFRVLGYTPETVTHPSSKKRLAALRQHARP